MESITFETYKDLTNNYTISQMINKEPSCINILSYRKFKVTIELIEEPKEVLIQRLTDMLNGTQNYKHAEMIQRELNKLK